MTASETSGRSPDEDLLVKIFRIFYTSQNTEFLRDRIYESRQTLGIPEVTRNQLDENLNILWHKDLIRPKSGNDLFIITEKGKSTFPEDFIWEQQRDRYNEIEEKSKKAKKWSRLAIVAVTLTMALMFGSLIFLSTMPLVFWMVLLLAALMIPLGFYARRRYSPFYLTSEEIVFSKVWKAYEYLRIYHSKKTSLYHRESLEKLDDAARILCGDYSARPWNVDQQLAESLSKLASYIRTKTVPSIEQGKTQEALQQVSVISSLFQKPKPAIDALVSFAESLPSEAPASRSWIIFLKELRSKPLQFGFIILAVFTILVFGGSYLIVTAPLEKSLMNSVLIIYLGWCTVVAAIVGVLVKR